MPLIRANRAPPPAHQQRGTRTNLPVLIDGATGPHAYKAKANPATIDHPGKDEAANTGEKCRLMAVRAETKDGEKLIDHAEE